MVGAGPREHCPHAPQPVQGNLYVVFLKEKSLWLWLLNDGEWGYPWHHL